MELPPRELPTRATRGAPVRRFNSLIASPSSRRWSSVEDLFGSGLLSSARARGSVKLIANRRSHGTPFHSIRHRLLIHSAAPSPLPVTERIRGISLGGRTP